MPYRIRQCVCLVSGIVLVSYIGGLDAQRRVPGGAEPKQAINVSLTIGEHTTYASREPGRCTHAPTASIYSILSEMWSVQQSSEGRSLALTLWRPKNGTGDMVTLSVSGGKSLHQINTVRGGGATSGTGKVTLDKSGAGGTFTIDGKTQEGIAVSGTIKCDAFAPHIAEGGL